MIKDNYKPIPGSNAKPESSSKNGKPVSTASLATTSRVST